MPGVPVQTNQRYNYLDLPQNALEKPAKTIISIDISLTLKIYHIILYLVANINNVLIICGYN